MARLKPSNSKSEPFNVCDESYINDKKYKQMRLKYKNINKKN